MTIPIVALSLWRSASSEVRHLRLVVGAIAFLSSILILDLQVDAQTSPPATGARKDLSDATAVVAPSVMDKNLHLSAISKALYSILFDGGHQPGRPHQRIRGRPEVLALQLPQGPEQLTVTNLGPASKLLQEGGQERVTLQHIQRGLWLGSLATAANP